MKGTVTVALVGVALGCVGLAMYLKPGPVLVVRSTSSEVPTRTAPSSGAATASEKMSDWNEVGRLGRREGSSLAVEFAVATNLKKFVDDRAGDPREGSFYFAAKSLEVCSASVFANQVAESHQREKSGHGRRDGTSPPADVALSVAAREKLSKICEGVRVGPELTELDVAAEGASNGDRFFAAAGPEPIFVMRAARSAPKNIESVIALANDYGNPYMLSSALEVLGMPHVMANLVVADEPVALLTAEKQAAMRTAFQLLKCDFGANCGKESPEVLFECAMTSMCNAESLDDVLKREFLRAGSRNEWSQVEAYRQRFADAIRRGDKWITLGKR